MIVFVPLILLIIILVFWYKSRGTETLKEFQTRLYAKYRKLTDDQIKTETTKSLKVVESLLNAAIKRYSNDNLHLVANYYKKIMFAVRERLPKDVEALDKLTNVESRRFYLVGMAVNVENFKAGGVSAATRRANRPLKVTDNEEELLKKLKNLNNKLLALINKALGMYRQKQLTFLIDFHEWLYDTLDSLETQFEDDLIKENSSDIRTKNLQLMLNDLTLVHVLEGGDPGDSEEVFPDWSRIAANASELAFKLQSFFY